LKFKKSETKLELCKFVMGNSNKFNWETKDKKFLPRKFVLLLS